MGDDAQAAQKQDHGKQVGIPKKRCQPLQWRSDHNPCWAICRGLIRPVEIAVDEIVRDRLRTRRQWIDMIKRSHASIGNIREDILRSGSLEE